MDNLENKKVDGIIIMEILDGEMDYDLNVDPLAEDFLSEFVTIEIESNEEDYIKDFENKKIGIVFSINSKKEWTDLGYEYDSEMEIHNTFIICDDLEKYYKMKNKYDSEEIENLFENGIPEVSEIFWKDDKNKIINRLGGAWTTRREGWYD